MLVNRAKVFVSNYQLVGISWNIEQGDGGYCGETLGLHGHWWKLCNGLEWFDNVNHVWTVDKIFLHLQWVQCRNAVDWSPIIQG